MSINHPISNVFVAIDVEYATRKDQSICQLGLAVVRNQEVVRNISWLIRPLDNEYDEQTMKVHHITPADTENQPSLEDLWPEIQPCLLEGQVWAHNARSVEQPVMQKNLHEYCISADWLEIFDSRDLFQRPDCPCNSGNGLRQCCMAMGIPFDETEHHDAKYDALKCAEIIIAYQKGKQPVWDGVPKNEMEFHKSLQKKIVLHMGEFQESAENKQDGIDRFAELTSSYEGAQPQLVDVFDDGDQMPKDGQQLVDFSRLNMGEDNPFNGKRIAITGFFNIPRKEIERAIKAMGGSTDGMTSKTDIALIGTKNVSLAKLAKIEKRWKKGEAPILVVGNDDLKTLLYEDSSKFFS